jgi:hypothetical protein
MSELYDGTELQLLTGYARAAEQDAWLRERGIPHRREGRRVLVSRVHVRAWLEGKEIVSSEGPNWGALNAPRKQARGAHA